MKNFFIFIFIFYFFFIQIEDIYVKKAFELFKPHLSVFINIQGLTLKNKN